MIMDDEIKKNSLFFEKKEELLLEQLNKFLFLFMKFIILIKEI